MPPIPRETRLRHLFWLTHGWCWFDGRIKATVICMPAVQSDTVLGPIPICIHCARQKGTKSVQEFILWTEEPAWGLEVGLTLPLEQHYNPSEWDVIPYPRELEL